MEKIVFLNTHRSGYDTEQCGGTLTIAELINLLNEYPGNTKVYFKNDNGYTYGSIAEEDIEYRKVNK